MLARHFGSEREKTEDSAGANYGAKNVELKGAFTRTGAQMLLLALERARARVQGMRNEDGGNVKDSCRILTNCQ